MWNETVRPTGFVLNQSSANWILADVSKFLGQTFVMAKAMIKEVPLPFYSAELRSNSFVVANQLRKRVVPIDPDQRMQMVRHKQQKIHIPTRAFVINPRSIKKHPRGCFIAKLICSALLTANRNEINGPESPGEMRRVIESLA